MSRDEPLGAGTILSSPEHELCGFSTSLVRGGRHTFGVGSVRGCHVEYVIGRLERRELGLLTVFGYDPTDDESPQLGFRAQWGENVLELVPDVPFSAQHCERLGSADFALAVNMPQLVLDVTCQIGVEEERDRLLAQLQRELRTARAEVVFLDLYPVPGLQRTLVVCSTQSSRRVLAAPAMRELDAMHD